MGGKATPATQVENSTTNTTGQTITNGSQVANSNTNNSNTVTPWEGIAPYLAGLAGQGEVLFRNGAPTYTGRYAAEPNVTQHQAVDSLINFSKVAGMGSEQVRQLGLDTVAGKFLNPESNPYIKAAVDASILPVTQQLQRSILPSISDGAVRGGAYGGDRQGIMEGVAAGDWAKASGGIGAQMYQQNYENERNRQMQAPALLDAANALGIQPSLLLKQAGDTQMGWENDLIQGGIAATAAQQRDQWLPMQNYANILSMFTPYTTTTGASSGNVNTTSNQTSNSTEQAIKNGTMTGTAAQASGGSKAISGALGGASAGSAFGPWGAGIGAVLGGLGSIF